VAERPFLPVPSRAVLGVAVIALLSFAVVGCDGEDAPAEVADPPAERLVRTTRVPPPPGRAAHRYSGRLAPPDDGALSFRVGGRVTSVAVEVGDALSPGQVVAELDPRDRRLSASQARARVEAAESRVDTAEQDRRRLRRLRGQDAASERDLEQAVNAYETARADLTAAERALALARRRVGYTDLEAPVAGTVVERLVDPGENVTAGQPILRYGSSEGVEAVFLVPAEVALRLESGMAAEVRLTGGADGNGEPASAPSPENAPPTPSEAGRSGDGADEEGRAILPARITEVAQAIDAQSPGYPIRAALTDPPESARPGRAISVSIALPEDRVLRVPPEALVEDGRGVHAYVVRVDDDGGGASGKRTDDDGEADSDDDGTGDAVGPETRVARVVRVPVAVSGVDRFGVRVTGGELAEGDLLVVAGLAGLQDGDRVRVPEGALR